MADHPPLRLYAATGDDVVRVDLGPGQDPRITTVLERIGAQCVALDPADPGRVLAGTFDNGAFLTLDGGQRWQHASDGIPHPRVLSVAISAPDRVDGKGALFAGTEPSNLYRSRDDGRNWDAFPALPKLPSAPTWSFPPRPWTSHVRWIEPDPHNADVLFVGIELGGVMRSTDGGTTWEDRKPGSQYDCHALAIHPVAHDRVYEAAGGGVAYSVDHGATWQPCDDGMDRHYSWGVAVDPEDPDLWYVSAAPGPGHAHSSNRDAQAMLYRTRGVPGGVRWEPLGAPGTDTRHARLHHPNAVMPYSLCTIPDWPNGLIVGMRDGTVLLSDDAGDTFQSLPLQLPGILRVVTARVE